MSGTPNSAAKAGVQGVLVVGMYESGAEIVGDLLGRMGLPRTGLRQGSEFLDATEDLNDALLRAVGGSRDEPPDVAPVEFERVLREFEDEARRTFLETNGPTVEHPPWVWADPRNSFLASFWARTLEADIGLLLVHRDPRAVVSAVTDRQPGYADPLGAWDRYNRFAMVQCAQWPSMALRYEDLASEPKETVLALGQFIESCGIDVDVNVDEALDLIQEQMGLDPPAGVAFAGPVSPHHQVLDRVLDQLGGGGDRAEVSDSGPSTLIDAVSRFYGEDYYGTSYDTSGIPYRRDERHWTDFFGTVAESIVGSIHPRTVLDAGCATGMLVEALRERGVDARGIDLSTWAIEQIPDALRPYCRVGSITEELDGDYDLITCVEVMEHLPPTLTAAAIANLTRHADAISFCSTPDDFDEPSHLNVEPAAYWARDFFRHGFVRDPEFDASFLAPHAILFRREAVDLEGLIANYERGLTRTATHLRDRLDEAIKEHGEVAKRYNDQADEFRSLSGRYRTDVAELQGAIGDVERRRAAEALAAGDQLRSYEAGQRRLAAAARPARRRARGHAADEDLSLHGEAAGDLHPPPQAGRRADAPVAGQSTHAPDGTYELWVEQFDTLGDGERQAIEDRLTRVAAQPLVIA